MSSLSYEPDILQRIDSIGQINDIRKKQVDELFQILQDRAKLE
jgi:hypothetical protein